MDKKQIHKQLETANHILNDIKKEYAKKSLKYGKFALSIQQQEINRLTNLMKSSLIFISLFLIGCSSEQDELNKDVKSMFEFIECPAMGASTNSINHSTSN